MRGKGLRGPKVYSISRICTTNYQQNYGIVLQTDAYGIPKFANLGTGGTSSDILTFAFTMNGVQVFVGGQGSLLTAPSYTAPMPGVTDFTSLFDSYMIDKIEIRAFASWSNNSVTGGTSVGQLPYIVHAFDNDDALSTTATNLMQKTGAKMEQFVNTGGGILLRTIRPSQAIQMYNTSTTTGYAPRRGYVDMGSPSVPHYAYKLALDNSSMVYNTNGVLGTIDFQFKYYLKLKFTI